ncbi:dihydropteroate synthase [bacterium]|nr:dihydropteroate synthase [bacterium]
MGILNVTPDSFTDGGLWFDTSAAIDHGLEMLWRGADIIDVGGESTRPGSLPVPIDEEVRRIVPVVDALAAEGAIVSIDTTKPEVAHAAVMAGASIVNDVAALREPGMLEAVAATDAGVVLVHMLGRPRTMQSNPIYEDVVVEVVEFLMERAAAAEAAGIQRDRICIDPGIGFGKTLEHNLALLASVSTLVDTGYPVLIGASRKSWISALLGDVTPAEKEIPTAAAHTLAIAGGVAVIRVHDVVAGLHAARVADAIVGWRKEAAK